MCGAELFSEILRPVPLYKKSLLLTMHRTSACTALVATQIDFPFGVSACGSLERSRMISHLGTSPCGALGETQGNSHLGLGSLFVCFIFSCMIVVCYCTVITQIYDRNCYKFGWLFILLSLDYCDWHSSGIPTTRAKGVGKCCLMCGPVKPFENENYNVV